MESSTEVNTLPANSYVPSQNVMVWNMTLDGVTISLAYCKDSASIWLNDCQAQCQERNVESETQYDFLIADHKAQLSVNHVANGPDKHVLVVDGVEVKQLRCSAERKKKISTV
ncbi:hypothetical protein EG68_08682 [Paragonimus skrjabini miyazakii]|uniref:Uncharacterized protein n=1 Tax=Paragonimus skrjabini miyazakii TaxID=59628 RepID=A0A8S9YRZ6_9TREM|nr:hypothetical protein EG68_08682 [Paragonimus skrjabini miyazakii]